MKHRCVVHYKLIRFAETELQVIVDATCDEAFYQSFVSMCKNSL